MAQAHPWDPPAHAASPARGGGDAFVFLPGSHRRPVPPMPEDAPHPG